MGKDEMIYLFLYLMIGVFTAGSNLYSNADGSMSLLELLFYATINLLFWPLTLLLHYWRNR